MSNYSMCVLVDLIRSNRMFLKETRAMNIDEPYDRVVTMIIVIVGIGLISVSFMANLALMIRMHRQVNVRSY
jgi:hypothetical protein